MEGRSFFFCILLLLAWKSSAQSEVSFGINKFWNGTSLPAATNVSLSLKGAPDSSDVILQITAPFYDDPAPDGPKGQPFNNLWDYEVVEAFFLNDDGQYLEVEVGPHGQHIVLLLNGVRNAVRHSLPMNVTTSVEGNTWKGTAVIPGDYFPPNVSKFNAFAKHGVGVERQHWSLYPADKSLMKVDNHALKFFQPIDMDLISPYHGSGSLSAVWKDALNGEVSFVINKFWNGTSLPAATNVSLSLKGAPDSSDVILQITAPFYDDPAPDGPKGQPFNNLWDYEVVEAFFLNDDGQYLEVEVGPHGQHIVLLLNGVRNAVRHSLPMNVTTSVEGNTWKGTAVIPGDYFPPNVSKFNAYAIHGVGMDRQYWSLYPADKSLMQPDFHALKFFQPIDMDLLSPYHGSGSLSTVWQDALNGQ